MWIRGAGILMVAAFVGTACIDESDSKNPGASSQQGSTAATPETSAATTTVTATLTEWAVTLSHTNIAHGTVVFEIRNNGTEDHAFEVTGANQEWKTEPIKPGQSATLSLALEAGAYDVYCPLASGGEAHSDRGMKTAITIR